MPHQLSSNALDLLYALETTGRAIPLVEILYDGTVVPGSGVSIIRNADKVGPSNGVAKQPVMFVLLLKLVNDPLLSNTVVTYNFTAPFNQTKLTQTSRGAISVLPAFFLPVKQFQIDLNADTTTSAGCTLMAIYDVMSQDTADLFTKIGEHTVKDILDLVAGTAIPESVSPRGLLTTGIRLSGASIRASGTVITRSVK